MDYPTRWLDAAWAEAEAALREKQPNRRLQLEQDPDGKGRALVVSGHWFDDTYRVEWELAGPTPAAALRALAERLRNG